MDSELQNDFFTEIEKSLAIKIPIQLKKLLAINGYTDINLIAKINEEDLMEIENFARADLPSLIDKSDYDNYYGIFSKNVASFKIVNGHRKILKMIQEYYKSSYKFDKPVIANVKHKTSSPSINEPKNSLSTDTESLKTDLPEETANVTKLILNWVETKCRPKCSDQTWIDLQRKCRNMKVNIYCDDLNKDIVGKIVCYCSEDPIKIFKLAKTTGRKKRWILSNFQRHFMKHIERDTPTPKKAKEGILHYFKPLEKEATCSNSENSSLSAIKDHTNSPVPSSSKLNIISNIVVSAGSSSTLSTDNHQNQRQKINPNINLNISEDILRDNTENNVNLKIETTPKRTTEEYEAPLLKNKQIIKSKWSEDKYSRQQRNQRMRDRIYGDQQKITDYFPYLETVQEFFRTNSEVDNQFRENIAIYNYCSKNTSDIQSPDFQTSNTFLRLLYDISIRNSSHTPNRNNYDDALKKFALYIYYTGGRLLYETLHANLTNILPSISCLYRYSRGSGEQYLEGVFYFEKLSKFLEERGLPKKVWISEDGTRITSKIEYDPKSNKIMGFVLPLNNGLPMVDTYMATSVQKIQSYFQNESKSKYAYVIMAQPLCDKVPAFCLSVFGTDNRFTSKDVQSRWSYIQKTAEAFGITVIGYSSDGDTRLLKAMRLNSVLPTPKEEKNTLNSWKWFQMGHKGVENDVSSDVSYVQDSIHIGTKLRTRLLKPNIILPLGKYFASVNHLQELIDTVSKDQHRLTVSDLKAEDKMNFLSAQKICTPRVRQLLLDNVPDSKGTIVFLKIMYFATESFIKKDLPTSTRVYYLWYCVFFLRAWRSWIATNKQYKIQENFLSSNCYLSIELNAHSLIKLILQFRDEDMSNGTFIPWLCNSQPCEKLFRATRSMTSTFSTVVNFSIRDILYRIDRIQMINNIINELSDDKGGNFIFPREKKRNTTEHGNFKSDLRNMTDDEIKMNVEKSLLDVTEDLNELGICVPNDDCFYSIGIPLKQEEMQEMIDDNEKEIDDVQITIVNEHDNNYSTIYSRTMTDHEEESKKEKIDTDSDLYSDLCKLSIDASFGDMLEIKDLSGIKDKELNEKDNCLPVIINEKSYIIKKSSLCWLLEEKPEKVSTDRVRRFIQNKSTTKTSLTNRRKTTRKTLPQPHGTDSQKIQKRKMLQMKCSKSQSGGRGRGRGKIFTNKKLKYDSESDILSETLSSDTSSDSINSQEFCDDNSDDVLSETPGEQNSDKEICIICQEYGKSEVWYRCTGCGKWVHSECSGAESPQNYICDFCISA